MLRSEIIRAVSNLQDVLKRTSVEELIMVATGLHPATTDRPQANLMDLYRSWVLASNEFGDTEKEILKIVRLHLLLDADFWSSILLGRTGERPQPAQTPRSNVTVRRTLERISVLSGELPQIVQLLRRDSDPIIATDKEETEDAVKIPSRIITILLKEEANKMSSPRRVVDAIESISIIYSVFAEIDGVSGNDLVDQI
jgi:hypothetical protein